METRRMAHRAESVVWAVDKQLQGVRRVMEEHNQYMRADKSRTIFTDSNGFFKLK